MSEEPSRIGQPTGAMACASCMSISQEQLIENEQSRLQQQKVGYPDRKNREQQKQAEERAHQDAFKRKG